MEMENEQVQVLFSLATSVTGLDGRVKATEKCCNNYIAFMADQREVNSQVKDFISRTDERATNEKEFKEVRDKEIKDSLEAHYAHRNLMVSIAAAALTLAGILVSVVSIIVGVWVHEHSGLNPFIEIPRHEASQVYTAYTSPSPQLAGDSRYRPYQR